ncbi:MAG TPA: S-layer homology domain-containing protein, partial [Chloroflexia bacterium]|nr:S-layer homology domain-containing protein [Chloroflexia bacterium]
DNGSSSWQGAADVATSPRVWQQRIGGDGMFARIEPVFGQRVYMEAQGGAMRRSDTGHAGPYHLGCLYDPDIPNAPGCVPTEFTEDAPYLSFIFPYEIYKGVPAGKGPGDECDLTPGEGCKHLIGGTNRVWEHLDGARGPETPWYPSSPVLTKNTLADRSHINQLAFAFRTDKIAIVGTNDGNVAIGFGLGAGQGISSTWYNVTGGNAVLPNRPILDVVLEPSVVSTTTNPVGFAAVGGFDQNTPEQPGHVFKVTCSSNCASATWENKSGNLPNIPVDAITANPNFPSQVFAGTDWGVYYTNDINAASPVWYRFNSGMPNVMIWDFAIDRGFTTLAAFTRSRGAFVWPLPSAPFAQTPTPTVTGTPPATATASPTSATRTPDVAASYTPVTPSSTPLPLATATPLACGMERPLLETFENGTLGVFTATTETDTGSAPWSVSSIAAHSGHSSAYVPNNTEVSLQALEMTNPVSITVGATGAQMEFWHRYSFEDDTVPYDGGVLEYSTDNGATWEDAGDLITEGGYDSIIIPGADNPLAGREGWTNQSPDYPDFNRVLVDLSDLVGQNVKFRFLHGSDQNTGEEGWYVDDLVITYTGTCVPPATRTAIALASASPTVTATACPVQFQDVPPSTDVSSFYPYVRCLACRGIVGGYPCGGTNPETGQAEPCGTSDDPYYRPSNQITRGQISKIVAGASDASGDPGPQIYQDVPPNSPFYVWINRLSNEHIMGGYPCGGPGEPCQAGNRPYFRPGANATRGQMSKIVSNAAGFNEAVGGQSFEDLPPSNSPSSYHEYVERLHARGIVSGYPCGGDDEECGDEGRPYFRPHSPVTRGQAAKIAANTFFPNCQTPARR